MGKVSAWFTGNRIAISRADAMKPPPQVCISCGANAAHVVRESVRTQNSSDVAPLFFALLVPYCEKHYRNYIRWTVVTWIILLVMLAPVVLGWLRPHYLTELGLPFAPNHVCAAFIVAGTVILLLNSRTTGVRFVAYDEEYIEARGVSPQYILAMHELQARRLDDVP
jgi:hypothetical protein